MEFDPLFLFKLPIRILKAFGMWMNRSSSKAYLFYGSFIHFTLVELFIILQFGVLFNNPDFEELSRLLTLLPTYFCLFLKTINFFYKWEEFQGLRSMVVELSEDCPEKQRLRGQLSTVDKLFKVYCFSAVSTCTVGGLVTINNLPYAMWFPWDTETNRLGYWTAAAYQVTSTLIASQMTIVIDSLPVLFMGYAVAFSDVLRERLSMLNANLDEKSSNHEEFKKCVEFHRKIKKFVILIQETYSSVLFIQSLLSSLVFCTIAVLLTSVSFLLIFL